MHYMYMNIIEISYRFGCVTSYIQDPDQVMEKKDFALPASLKLPEHMNITLEIDQVERPMFTSIRFRSDRHGASDAEIYTLKLHLRVTTQSGDIAHYLNIASFSNKKEIQTIRVVYFVFFFAKLPILILMFCMSFDFLIFLVSRT